MHHCCVQRQEFTEISMQLVYYVTNSCNTSFQITMHFLRAAASGLILGQTSHAWLLQFANIGSCVESDQVEEKGPADGNECVALAMSDAVAMTITGW